MSSKKPVVASSLRLRLRRESLRVLCEQDLATPAGGTGAGGPPPRTAYCPPTA